MSTRTSFRLDATHCNRQINFHFLKSFGYLIYLGDWHRHPGQKKLEPSRKDELAMLALTNDTTCGMPEALLLIVDVDKKDKLQTKGFLFIRGKRRFKSLRIVIKQ